jgi:hypothetical protein
MDAKGQSPQFQAFPRPCLLGGSKGVGGDFIYAVFRPLFRLGRGGQPVYLLTSSGSLELRCVMAEPDATDGSRGVGCRTPSGIPEPGRNAQLRQGQQLVPRSDFWVYSFAGATFVA